ncbi:MAG: hypothetical protein ACD_19C00014G0048 [uncultured bacterium]|nr:MAG: hypothetical protein ACD_19C00014G0048 [uncultured bacterium]
MIDKITNTYYIAMIMSAVLLFAIYFSAVQKKSNKKRK